MPIANNLWWQSTVIIASQDGGGGGTTPSFSDAGPAGSESFHPTKYRNLEDAGAEGAEDYGLTKHKVILDAGEDGDFGIHMTRQRYISDAGAEGSEIFDVTITVAKSFSDAGAEGAELFNKELSTHFPQVPSITPSVFSSFSTTHNVAMPATVGAGDGLICLLTTGNVTVTTPSGWELKGSGLDLTNNVKLSVYTKDAVGNEDGATVNFITGSSSLAAAQVYRIDANSWHGDISLGFAIGSFPNGVSANPNPPSLNPSNWDVLDTLWIAVKASYNGGTVSVYPSSYANGAECNTSLGVGDLFLASCRRENAVASEDPGTFTISGAFGWVACTIAIRPSLGIPKSFVDAGAEGGETWDITFPDGTHGKFYQDSGAEGAEVFDIVSRQKYFEDAGAEGTEAFTKTRFINPAFLKNRFEAILVKVLDS